MNKRLFIYDMETNGKWSPVNQPIEIAVKVIEKDGTETNYHQYIKCQTKIPKYITEINNITDDMLRKKGVLLGRAFEEVAELLFKPDTLVIGHRILAFDNMFLNYYMKKNKFGKEIWNRDCFDTAGQSKAEAMGTPNISGENWGEFHCRILRKMIRAITYNLKISCERYGVNIEQGGFHSAQTDTEYTYRLFLAQYKVIKETYGLPPTLLPVF